MIITENGVSYELNQADHTAKAIKSYDAKDNILVPKFIRFQSQDYIITRIGEDSFQENKNIKSISFSNNSYITIIDRNAFDSTLIETISIPDSVIRIEEYSFIWCKSLTTINISEKSNLHTIGPRAFVDVPIQSLFFPSKLEKLEEGWCDRISSLKNIIVSPQNNYFNFTDNQYLLGRTESKVQIFNIFYFARRDITQITILSRIKEISPFAFNKCINLKSIEFQENSELKTIGNSAFRECISLESIKIPSTLNEIGNETFYNCFNLKTVDFGENSELLKIGNNSFHGCHFQTFSIPSTVTQIGSSAFSYCLHLKKFLIPDNSKLVSLPRNVFNGAGLKGIVIPSHITKFGYCIFAECKQLKSVEFLCKNLQLGDNFFNECDHLIAVSFPDSVKVTFGQDSFYKANNNCSVFFNIKTIVEFNLS